jgi:hypothetical protein
MSGAVTWRAAVIEAAAGHDGNFAVRIIEMVQALEELKRGVAYFFLVPEGASAAELVGPRAAYVVLVPESVSNEVVSGLVSGTWVPVDDAQSGTWVPVDDGQSGTWTPVPTIP